MTFDQWINLLVTVTLIEMMIGIGLSVTFAELLSVLTNWRLVAKALLANYVLFPAATVALLLWFQAPPLVSVGFLILAVCPGAPFGPPLTGIAKGNVTTAVGLMVMLAGSSAVLAPILLGLLLPLVSETDVPQVNAAKIVFTLLLTQLIPLCIGLAVRKLRPLLAERLQKPANTLAKLLNLAAVVLILVAQYQTLAEVRLASHVGMVILLLASWAAGWLLGGPGPANRITMTLTTSLRNLGVGLVIATGNFGGTPAVTAALVYGLVEVFGSLLLAVVWGRSTSRPGFQ